MSHLPPLTVSGLLLGTALLVLAPAQAAPLPEEALEAQQHQAELQARIDAADEATRERLRELRRLERDTQRLEGLNGELAPRLAQQATLLARREAALDTLEETREALPVLKRRLIERLAAWVEQDLPFLRKQRRARVASLEASLADPALSEADRVERILAAWRAELDYGREFDAWRGTLSGTLAGTTSGDDSGREVDFLRLARVGFYYLTPDGREGGVWRAAEQRWVALDEAERREVQIGLRIARDQRAPQLLTLPLSQPLELRRAPSPEIAEGRS